MALLLRYKDKTLSLHPTGQVTPATGRRPACRPIRLMNELPTMFNMEKDIKVLIGVKSSHSKNAKGGSTQSWGVVRLWLSFG